MKQNKTIQPCDVLPKLRALEVELKAVRQALSGREAVKAHKQVLMLDVFAYDGNHEDYQPGSCQ